MIKDLKQGYRNPIGFRQWVVHDTYDMEKFNQFFSQNKYGFIGTDEFRNQVSELQNNGYITFVFNDRNSCFRQFL